MGLKKKTIKHLILILVAIINYTKGDFFRTHISVSEQKEYNYGLENLKTNWTFSNSTQARNAFRLNFITEDRFNNLHVRFENSLLKEEKLKEQFNQFRLKYGFRSLSVDAPYTDLPKPQMEAKDPTGADCIEELTFAQKVEYIKAFSSETEYYLVLKYSKLRVQRIFEDFIGNPLNHDQFLMEIQLLQEINEGYFVSYTEPLTKLISAFSKLDYEDTITYLSTISEIKNSYCSENTGQSRSAFIMYNNKQYEVQKEHLLKRADSILEFIEIPNSILRTAIKNGNHFLTQAD